MPNIASFLHITVLVQDLNQSLDFYCGLLGLKQNEHRPDLGFSGVWLHVGSQELHLMVLPNPDPVDGRPVHGGRDRHIALAVSDLTALHQRLVAADVACTLSRSGRNAIFCRDPDGNALEFVGAVPSPR